MSPGRDTGLGPARQPPRACCRDESRPPVLPVLAIQPGPLCRTSRGSPPAGRVWRLAPDACYLSADRAGRVSPDSGVHRTSGRGLQSRQLDPRPRGGGAGTGPNGWLVTGAPARQPLCGRRPAGHGSTHASPAVAASLRSQEGHDPPAARRPSRAGQHALRAGGRDPRGHPPGLRPRPGRGPDRRGRPGAVPPGRRHQRGGRRGLDREHQPHPRPVHRGRGLPDPAAPDGGQRRAVGRLVPALRGGPGRLARHAG